MGMKKNKKIEKWIDFDKLPHNKGRINWMESIGSELNFKYGDIEGVLKILSRLKDSDSVFVYIEGYTDECGKQINISKLKDCKLGAFFKKPIAITHPELVKYFYNEEYEQFKTIQNECSNLQEVV